MQSKNREMTSIKVARAIEETSSEHHKEPTLLRRFAQCHTMTDIRGADSLAHNALRPIHNRERAQLPILPHNQPTNTL